MLLENLIPPSYTLIKKSNLSLLLKNDFKDLLLQKGIEDLKTFFKAHLNGTRYLSGRTSHPSISLDEGKRMVVRQYRHGGLFRFISRDLFLFGARAFQELTLTEEIRSSGIPTVQPVGAIHQRVAFLFYRAYLLTLEISDARDLIRYFKENGPPFSLESLLHKRKTIRTAGLLLRTFHQKGFYHRDLQLKNLLVSEDRVLIIDFDRSCRKATLSSREKIKNLLRLNRSVEKWKRFGLTITKTDLWRFFLAYSEEDPEIRKAIRRRLRIYSAGLFFHRIGWALEDLIQPQLKKLQFQSFIRKQESRNMLKRLDSRLRGNDKNERSFLLIYCVCIISEMIFKIRNRSLKLFQEFLHRLGNKVGMKRIKMVRSLDDG